MIAWVWSVYPRLSTDPMVAAGITDRPDKARHEVESALSANQSAAWGILQQVRVSLGDLCQDSDLLSMWPATGVIPVMCRRDLTGGFVWKPVLPSLS